MNKVLDTGRMRIEPKENTYLHFSLYADGEIPGEDMVMLRNFLDRFAGKVSLVVTRDSDYWLSAAAQKVMFKDAADRVHAVAYVDKNKRQEALSQHAMQTYLSGGVEVKSCSSVMEAFEWIKGFGRLPEMV